MVGESFIPLSKGSTRSFIPFPLPLPRYFFASFSLLFPPPPEERDVSLGVFPRHRVWIRFSRQIPCPQAAATFPFGIQPRASPPLPSILLFSLFFFFFFFSPRPSFTPLSSTVHGSRSYGFLSLINYRVELSVGGSGTPPFSPFPFCLLFFFFLLPFGRSTLFALVLSLGRNAPDRRTLRGIMKRHPAVNDFLNKMTPSGERFKDKLSATGKLSIIAGYSPGARVTAVQIITRAKFLTFR